MFFLKLWLIYVVQPVPKVKKLSIIGLLLLLLLNAAGYYGVFLTAWFQNNQTMISQFDADAYNADDVKMLKIPITIPYPIQDNGFERVDGVFEHNGEFYRLIKQRFYQDTLHVICIKDVQRKNIHQALTDYVKTFTDQPASSKSGAKIKIDFIKVYLAPRHSSAHVTAGWTYTLSFSETSTALQPVFLSIPSPPPEA